MNWRRFFRREAIDAEQREELESYLDLTADEYTERGMDPAEARAAACKKLGNATWVREEIYQMNTSKWIEGTMRDVRHALRMIRSKPGFSGAVLLTLALGIGANTAIFSVVNAVLLRPLPYPEPEALVGVYMALVMQNERFENAGLSPGMYAAFKERSDVFEDFGVWTMGSASVTGVNEPEQIVTVTMTEGVLPSLGVRPYLGRLFSTEDDTQGAPETVVLSYAYWQRKLGGDPRVLERTILIDFRPRHVVGVMPAAFRFLDLHPDVLLPQRFPSSGLRPDEFSYNGLARLKPGTNVAGANQDLSRLLGTWGDTEGVRPMIDRLRIEPNLRPLKRDVVGNVSAVLQTLMGALGLVLLLVCANVANLVLVRARSRRQEFAVRSALGAGQGRIARELLVESLTLAVLGGALGVALAYGGIWLLAVLGPESLPRLADISMDGTSVAFALVCSLAASGLFGLAAVLHTGVPARIQTARGATQGREQFHAQNALAMTQVALALVLVVASGLMIRSFVAMRAVDPGFTEPARIQTARVLIPEALAREPAQVIRMQAEILRRLAAIPGVLATGFTTGLPMDPDYRNGRGVAVEGKTPVDEIPPNRRVKSISPGLLAAQGTRLIAGRDFTWDDVFSQRRLAIVSENMARESWGEPTSAVGKRIRMGTSGPWTEVVGVAETVHEDGANQPAPATVYLRGGVDAPVPPGGSAGIRRGVTLAIRTDRAGTEAFLKEMTAAIHDVNPNLPLAKVRTMDELYRLSMARASFALALLGAAGAMALTLAIVGVYSVLAYAVAQRRREVGIRIALGAEPGRVKASFLRQGLVQAVVGGAIGVGSAVALSRWISSLLFGVKPLDPATYAIAVMIVLAAAMMASYLPARRAAEVDPMETIRND